MEKLPPLTPEAAVKLEVLMALFFEQFWTFAEFINDSNEKVPTWKYADFILYAFKKKLEEKYPNNDNKGQDYEI